MQNKTLFIVIIMLLLTTGLTATGAVKDIKTNTAEEISTLEQENYYRGYTFAEDSPAYIKTDMKKIIDQVYIEKAKLYLMEQKEKELLDIAEDYVNQKMFYTADIYHNEIIHLREEIRPQRYLTLELTNFEDTSYAYCLKDLDIAVENIEILKEVEKIISKN